MTTNEHTEQSARDKLIERLGKIQSTMIGSMLFTHDDVADIGGAAALLAADKAGGNLVGEVESALPGAGGFHVRLARGVATQKVGTKLYTHPQPQPSALPDDVAKDAALTALKHIRDDSWPDAELNAAEYAAYVLSTIDAAMLKEKHE